MPVTDEELSDFVLVHRGYRPTSEQVKRCRKVLEGTVLSFFGIEERPLTFISHLLSPITRPEYKNRGSMSAKIRRIYPKENALVPNILEPLIALNQMSTKDEYRLAQGVEKEYRAVFCWSSEVLRSQGVDSKEEYFSGHNQMHKILEKVEAAEANVEGLQILKPLDISTNIPLKKSMREKTWMSYNGENICRGKKGVSDVLRVPCLIVTDIHSFLQGEETVLAVFEPEYWILVGPGRLVFITTVQE